MVLEKNQDLGINAVTLNFLWMKRNIRGFLKISIVKSVPLAQLIQVNIWCIKLVAVSAKGITGTDMD